MAEQFGQFLLNESLPDDYKLKGVMTKKELYKRMTQFGKERPEDYVKAISAIKRTGDQIATLEGLSVGLDDIEPMYKERDRIMNAGLSKVKAAKGNFKKIERALVDTQDKMIAHTKGHTGSMAVQALSGARGNIPQLMKSVSSPVLAMDDRGKVRPWLVQKSYAEGLSPGDYWVTGDEARMGVIAGVISVSEPGDLSKILINSVNNQLVTTTDCGTHNGIMMQLDDPQATDRYLADSAGPFPRNTLLTSEVSRALSKTKSSVKVRSPMTCEAGAGLCQMCQGLDEKGSAHKIGTNVGTRAAQALSEPLTQFMLSAKHGVRVAKNGTKHLPGLRGVRQTLDVPNSFIHKATLSSEEGKVGSVDKAPQGGYYVNVNQARHYVPPSLSLKVRRGDFVEQGDALSDGVPKPDEVVKYKGLGEGRKHLVDTIHGLYKEQGVNIDKRHLEILAKSQLNHVRVMDDHPDFLRGELVTYGAYKNSLKNDLTDTDLARASGQTLGEDTLHYTAGTRITPSVSRRLGASGIKTVNVANNAPKVEFEMTSITRAPLLNPDWMARLSHRFLKKSIMEGAQFGESSDIHGTHPVPAYIYGAELGKKGDDVY